jgi:hypothetical protein
MNFIRENWQIEKFGENSTSITCGFCFAGSLMPGEFKLGSKYSFSAILKCPACKKSYACIGHFKYFSREGKYLTTIEVGRGYLGPKAKIYYPLNFFPYLSIFYYPKQKLSDEFNHEVDLAFSHFWNDPTASSNKIRRALEHLMDYLNVPMHEKLHHRIEEFKKTNPEVGEKLMAIKHIGNAGSHKEIVLREDILDAFQLLHFSLNQLYPSDQEQKIREISIQINSTKGLRSKKAE